MPCYDSRVGDSVEVMVDNPRMVTMLCSACRALEKQGFDFDLNPRLSEWWSEHKKEDEAREIREIQKKLQRDKAKRIAKTKNIADLTKAEKSLLRKFGLI